MTTTAAQTVNCGDRLSAAKQAVWGMVGDAEGRLTCRDVATKTTRIVGSLSLHDARQVINQLVDEGSLRYVNDCGASFLEKNYIGEIRLSPHVTVNTQSRAINHGSRQPAGIFLMPGAAFGDCRHPTTRLAVRGIDFVVSGRGNRAQKETAIDIGTGSGILAIAAAHLGVMRVMATDIDPCARKEARDNIQRNGMASRIRVSNIPLAHFCQPFSFIFANLRLPTLKQQASLITEKLLPGGAVVLSGVKTEEAERLLAMFGGQQACVWQADEGGWSGFVFIKEKR